MIVEVLYLQVSYFSLPFTEILLHFSLLPNPCSPWYARTGLYWRLHQFWSDVLIETDTNPCLRDHHTGPRPERPIWASQLRNCAPLFIIPRELSSPDYLSNANWTNIIPVGRGPEFSLLSKRCSFAETHPFIILIRIPNPFPCPQFLTILWNERLHCSPIWSWKWTFLYQRNNEPQGIKGSGAKEFSRTT